MNGAGAVVLETMIRIDSRKGFVVVDRMIKLESLGDYSTRSTSTGDYSMDFSTRIARRLLNEDQLAP